MQKRKVKPTWAKTKHTQYVVTSNKCKHSTEKKKQQKHNKPIDRTWKRSQSTSCAHTLGASKPKRQRIQRAKQNIKTSIAYKKTHLHFSPLCVWASTLQFWERKKESNTKMTLFMKNKTQKTSHWTTFQTNSDSFSSCQSKMALQNFKPSWSPSPLDCCKPQRTLRYSDDSYESEPKQNKISNKYKTNLHPC